MPSTEFPATTIADLIASGAYVFVGKHGDGTGGTVALVNSIDDVLDLDDLTPQTGWAYLGASREGQGSSYEQAVATQELRVDQDTSVVFENIQSVDRTITAQMAEFNPDHLALLEESTVDTPSGLWKVDGKSFTTRARYRVALIGRKEPGYGQDITNSGSEVRGELLGVVLQNASISAGNLTFELQRGQLANVPVAFKGYPDTSGVIVTWVGETGPTTVGS